MLVAILIYYKYNCPENIETHANILWMLYNIPTTMSSAILIFPAICFILIQVISINIARGESSTTNNNTTHHAFQWKSDRLKRSPPGTTPERLRIQVRYPTGKIIELNWMKQKKYLANQYLPVMTSSNLNVMEAVGDFDIYQDVEKCSAVVYFKKYNSLFGVIGLNYAITNLPYKFNVRGIYPGQIEGSYISERAGVPVHNNPLLFSTHAQGNPPLQPTCGAISGIKRPSNSDPGPTNKHQREERDVPDGNIGEMINANVSSIRKRRGDSTRDNYYLEILVFVTSDIVEFFKELYGAYYLEWIVRYYILYFNSVDMVFKQQRTFDLVLNINIAKIVIEDNSKPFNFINNNEIQFTDTVVKLREYLKINQGVYTPDSYDHVFISTRRTIMDKSILVAGTRDYGIDLYSARKNNEFYNGVPITIVGFDYDYVIAVHEISRTLKIDSDSWVDGLKSVGQCSSIMQEGSSKCDECFKWNEDSKKQFRTFFGTHLNRCFLLNEPRSIRPPGISRFLSPTRQCQCYGYHSCLKTGTGKITAYVKTDECHLDLLCGKLVNGLMSHQYTVRPFDGTNCSNKKVCWNGQCTDLNN